MNFDPTTLSTIIALVVVAFVLFYLISVFVKYLTDVVKGTSRGLAKLPAMSWISISGLGSVFAALVVSVAIVFFPGNTGVTDALSQIFGSFHLSIDPTLVKAMAALLVWIIANAQHNSGSLPSVLPEKKK